ncbi:hypothetical protein ABEF95_012316 [Exophiala dermatitidis]
MAATPTTTTSGTTTTIIIEGRATICKVAERASLTVDISDSGYDKEKVAKNVIETANTLQDELDQLCPRIDWTVVGQHSTSGGNDFSTQEFDSGGSTALDNDHISPNAPVSFYSISSLTTSSRTERLKRDDDSDYDDDDDDNDHMSDNDKDKRRRKRKIYTAETSIDVRFRDFVKLGEVVVQWSATPYVQLSGIDWSLTDDSAAVMDEQVRVTALHNAIKRAKKYAAIIAEDCGGDSEKSVPVHVHPVKIGDDRSIWAKGLTKQTARKATAKAAFGIGAGIDFEPKVIEDTVDIKVEFQVSAGK